MATTEFGERLEVLVLALFATMDSTDQNVVLRYLIEVVILEGKATRICWKPEARVAFGLTESGVVIG